MAEICDYGDFHDWDFPGKGRHHTTVYIPRCTKEAKYEYPYHHMTLVRCEEHKISVG